MRIELTYGVVTVEQLESGEYWYLVEWDNGQHPNSPYYDTFEHEDGPFETATDAEYEGRVYLNNRDWGV